MILVIMILYKLTEIIKTINHYLLIRRILVHQIC